MKYKKIFLVTIIAIIIGFLTGGIAYLLENTNNIETLNDISNHNSTQDLLNNANKAYYNNDLMESLSNYKKIISLDFENNIALKNLYFINKEAGDYSAALDYLENYMENNPNDLFWKYRLGVLYYQLADFSQANKTISEVIFEVNNNTDEINLSKTEISYMYYYLGKTKMHLNYEDLAEELFNKSIEYNENLAVNYLSLAKIYQKQNKLEKALVNFLEALKKDSSLSLVFPDIAKIYENSGDYEQAYRYWQRSISAGVSTELARNKLNNLKEEFPEFEKDEIEKKEISREKIAWGSKSLLENTDNIPILRIGLVNHAENINFQTSVEFDILDSNNNIVISGLDNEEWNIKLDNGTYHFYNEDKLVKSYDYAEHLTIQTAKRGLTSLYDINYGQGYFWAGTEDRQYRGNIELLAVNNNNFHIINNINVEEYLFSVVPAEMPAWWPEEALKAQSIAARSYALSHQGRHLNNGYDLCDSVHCAAYNGVNSENINSTNAVLSTKGQAAYHSGNIISAVFSANSGGYSEKSSEIWGSNHAYLQGANNMFDTDIEFPLEPYQLERWLIEGGESYSNITIYSGNNSYRWQKPISVEYLENKYDLKKLVDVIIKSRSSGGSVSKINICGLEKTIEISGDRIRSALGGLKNNRFFMEKHFNENNELRNIIVIGGGWGHNVGMDQTAAAGMAEKDYDYKSIISHFYNDTVIKKAY